MTTTTSPPERRVATERAATWAFAAVVAVGLAYIQFGVKGPGWFAGDDWFLLTDGQRLASDNLTRDINGHWVLIPRMVFTALWQVGGLDHFWLYKLLAVVSHGSVVVLLRAVMRRAGVSPWTATVAAAGFLVLGAGGENILFPLQFALTGALACGLAHLLLVTRTDPTWRTDAAGLAIGTSGLMFSGLALPLTFAVGVVLLLRRGWRTALVQTAPIGLVYLAWASAVDANRITDSPPSIGVVVSFVVEGQEALLTALAGGESVVALLFGLVLVGGIALVLQRAVGDGRTSPSDLVDLLRTHAIPLALWAAALLFNSLLARNIHHLGSSAVWAIRYVYIGAALGLPILAAAADAIARRVPRAWIALLAVALLPIPSNVRLLQEHDFAPFDPEDDERVVALVVRAPFARDVDPDVRPIPDDAHVGVTIGFLLGAVEDGRFHPGSAPLNAAEVAEAEVRLGFASEAVPRVPEGCRPIPLPVSLSPEVGDRLVIGGPVGVAAVGPDGAIGPEVVKGSLGSEVVDVQLPDLEVRISGTGPLCELAPGGTSGA